jgi:hypothetical protein
VNPPTCGFWTQRLYTDTARSPRLAGQLCSGCGSLLLACDVIVDTRDDSDDVRIYHVGHEPFVRRTDWRQVAS